MAGSSKKKSKSVAFTANQGVRVDGARNAVVEESEEEEEPEEEVIDTRLYCICKQMYDDDRLMIACDKYVNPSLLGSSALMPPAMRLAVMIGVTQAAFTCQKTT